jgi:hypothetical protein
MLRFIIVVISTGLLMLFFERCNTATIVCRREC